MSTYYDQLADELAERYERLDFEEVHATLVEELPDFHARVLDVGAGSGRDAAALAGRDHHVVAVEPSGEMRRRARALHDDPRIRWLDDALPDLDGVYDLGEKYDLILLSAVWMHVLPAQRDQAMRRLAGLLRPGGKLVISARTVASDRPDMYPVVTGELVARAREQGLEFLRESRSSDLLQRHEVAWTTVIFRAPDDGTSALPILRNIIVNDSKFTTYKFGLLRVLLRIAAGSPGLVQSRDDGFVDVPMGLIALYWLRVYEPLLARDIRQSPNHRYSFGPALMALRERVSPYDLRVGARFHGEEARLLFAALRDARKAITASGPAKFITYSDGESPIFVAHNERLPRRTSALELHREFLWSFGFLRIPDAIYEAMSRHWVWIEPGVINAWLEKTQRLDDSRRAYEEYVEALSWQGDDPRDTTVVAALVESFAQARSPVACGVWTGQPLRTRLDFEVDHCIPYSRWFNNSLWNLLPSTPAANRAKRDRLPSMKLLMESRERITSWWAEAFAARDEHAHRFAAEASASLPGLNVDAHAIDVQEVFDAASWQVGRIRRDQQIAEWAGL